MKPTSPRINSYSNFAHLIIVLAVLLLISHTSRGQRPESYPQDYFGSPLEIPLYLAGNFGEIRPNHFHAGLDLKTEGEEGKNILAAADGFVYRIKIQLGGYGKVLYIKHPNGYSTTYAHLQRFSPEIEAYVQSKQYNRKTFTIELFPGPNELKVQKGQVIAISGNTGGSGGPHLHFEIRKNDIPVNPLLFGFDIKDDLPPTIHKLAVYPMDTAARVNSKNEPYYVSCTGARGEYKVAQPIKVHGQIGLGVEVRDYTNGSSNRCGVYSIGIRDESNQLLYLQEMEKVGFHETRYINSLVDYSYRDRTGHRIQKSFIDPNNKLSIYSQINNHGHLNFTDSLSHHMHYEVKDSYGNTSTLGFTLNSTTISNPVKHTHDYTTWFKYDQPNSFQSEGVVVSLPSHVLYKDFGFKYNLGKRVKGCVADVHELHDYSVPLHKYMTVSIAVDSGAWQYSEQLLAVSLMKDGSPYAEGGHFTDGHVTFKTRSFGPYTVMIDSTPPRIKPHNIYNGKSMTGQSEISFKISDNLSGIDSYNGYIDGEWVLFEFDKKTDKLFHEITTHPLNPGDHKVKIIVLDEMGNQKETEVSFTY